MRSRSKSEHVTYSGFLSAFLAEAASLRKHYERCASRLEDMDKSTQDYLHMLEIDNLNYAERAKLATKLQEIRKDRRYYKDTIDVLTPLIEFTNQNPWKNTLHKLNEILQKMLIAEEAMEKRSYKYRILSETDRDAIQTDRQTQKEEIQ